MSALAGEASEAALGASRVPDLQDNFLAKFVVKNLDTGETFNVDQIESFLQESSLLTFEGTSASGWSVAIPEVKQFGGTPTPPSSSTGADSSPPSSSGISARKSSSRASSISTGSGTGPAMKPFTAYKIFVTNRSIVKNRRTFSMYRRYSEFVRLDRQLREGGWEKCIKLSPVSYTHLTLPTILLV